MRILTPLKGSTEYPKGGIEIYNWYLIFTGADLYDIYGGCKVGDKVSVSSAETSCGKI